MTGKRLNFQRLSQCLLLLLEQLCNDHLYQPRKKKWCFFCVFFVRRKYTFDAKKLRSFLSRVGSPALLVWMEVLCAILLGSVGEGMGAVPNCFFNRFWNNRANGDSRMVPVFGCGIDRYSSRWPTGTVRRNYHEPKRLADFFLSVGADTQVGSPASAPCFRI